MASYDSLIVGFELVVPFSTTADFRSHSVGVYACRSVIEYSQVGYGVQIGDETVLSYVTVGDNTHIPSGLVLQTVPLKHNRYVTFAFGPLFCEQKLVGHACSISYGQYCFDI